MWQLQHWHVHSLTQSVWGPAAGAAQLRMLCQFRNDLLVEILPPYVPSAEEKASPALYAANIRKLMADRLGVPLVDQDRSYFLALEKAGVAVGWEGRRVEAPPGVVGKDGRMDLGPYMAEVQASLGSRSNGSMGSLATAGAGKAE
jgi:hypothetical protein